MLTFLWLAVIAGQWGTTTVWRPIAADIQIPFLGDKYGQPRYATVGAGDCALGSTVGSCLDDWDDFYPDFRGGCAGGVTYPPGGFTAPVALGMVADSSLYGGSGCMQLKSSNLVDPWLPVSNISWEFDCGDVYARPCFSNQCCNILPPAECDYSGGGGLCAGVGVKINDTGYRHSGWVGTDIYFCPSDCVDADSCPGLLERLDIVGAEYPERVVYHEFETFTGTGMMVTMCHETATGESLVDAAGESRSWYFRETTPRAYASSGTGFTCGGSAFPCVHVSTSGFSCESDTWVEPSSPGGSCSWVPLPGWALRFVIDWEIGTTPYDIPLDGVEHVSQQIGSLNTKVVEGFANLYDAMAELGMGSEEAEPFDAEMFDLDPWINPGLPAGTTFTEAADIAPALIGAGAETNADDVGRTMGPIDDLAAIVANSTTPARLGGTGSAPSIDVPFDALSGGQMDDVPLNFASLKTTLHGMPAWMAFRTVMTYALVLSMGVTLFWIVLWMFGFTVNPFGGGGA